MPILGTLIYGFLWSVLNLLRYIGWFRWRFEGLENIPRSGGVILVGNHVDWMDIPVHGTLMPRGRWAVWLGKTELFQTRVGHAFFSTMNVIPVQRGQNDSAALNMVVQHLQKGQVVIIYPEGHRSRNGVLLRGKPGALLLAAQSGCPLVPMAITGTEHGLRGTLLRREVVVRIGSPFPPPPISKDNLSLRAVSQHTNEMMQRIAALLPEDRRGPYATPAADKTSDPVAS